MMQRRWSGWIIIGVAVLLFVLTSVRERRMLNTEFMHELSDATFATQIEAVEGLALVDFWAPWCAVCRVMMPQLDELASEYQGRVVFFKVNVDEYPELAEAYRVTGLPQLFLFRDGRPVDGRMGRQSRTAMRDWIEAHL